MVDMDVLDELDLMPEGLTEAQRKKLRKSARDAYDQWVRDNIESEGAIAEFIHKLLDADREETLNKLVGFSSRWGGLEIDHCNGRVSALDGIIKARAEGVIGAWIDEVLEEKGWNPTAQMAKLVHKAYRDAFFQEARDQAEALGRKHACDYMTDLAQRQAARRKKNQGKLRKGHD